MTQTKIALPQDLGLVSAQNEGVNRYIYFWTPLMNLDLVQIPS